MKKNSFLDHFQVERELVRPIVYQVFTRFLICLCLALLWDFFFNQSGLRSKGIAFLFFALYFFIMAWLAYLRIDGVQVPKFDRKLFQRRRKPIRAYGDMVDYLDEEIVKYEDLDDEEKDRCLLLSNLITAALFLVLSLFF